MSSSKSLSEIEIGKILKSATACIKLIERATETTWKVEGYTLLTLLKENKKIVTACIPQLKNEEEKQRATELEERFQKIIQLKTQEHHG